MIDPPSPPRRASHVALTILWSSFTLFAMTGCERPLEVPASTHLSVDAREALLRYECNRCHTIAEVDPPPLQKHCTGCHAQIIDGTYPEQVEMHATWREHIKHLRAVPSLDPARPLFQRQWLVDYLSEPHDLRPRLGEQMPRLALAAEDIEVIADALSPSPQRPAYTIKALRGDATRGKHLVDTMGCGTCHVMTGAKIAASPIPVEAPPDQLASAMTFAPDLSSVRGRMAPDVLAIWLRDPERLKQDALMPAIPMSEQDARDMATYLLSVNLEPSPARAVPARLPVLDRPVLYAEVEQKVFKKVCWHCHSEGDYVGGDGGPGNTGGFGFPGRGLSLAEYSAIASGMKDREGRRMSVFKKREDGTPWIVAAMHARHAEVAGEPVEGIRGMPLGLPPMTLEEIQLVESWVAQGRPK